MVPKLLVSPNELTAMSPDLAGANGARARNRMAAVENKSSDGRTPFTFVTHERTNGPGLRIHLQFHDWERKAAFSRLKEFGIFLSLIVTCCCCLLPACSSQPFVAF